MCDNFVCIILFVYNKIHMVCPCIIAPYFMLGPLTYLYTYLSNNIAVLAILLLLSFLTIYVYMNPEIYKTSNDN